MNDRIKIGTLDSIINSNYRKDRKHNILCMYNSATKLEQSHIEAISDSVIFHNEVLEYLLNNKERVVVVNNKYRKLFKYYIAYSVQYGIAVVREENSHIDFQKEATGEIPESSIQCLEQLEYIPLVILYGDGVRISHKDKNSRVTSPCSGINILKHSEISLDSFKSRGGEVVPNRFYLIHKSSVDDSIYLVRYKKLSPSFYDKRNNGYEKNDR